MDITPDDLAAGFAVAARDIAPAMQWMDVAALIAAFALIGDVLTGFGITEAQTGRAGPAERAALQPSRPPLRSRHEQECGWRRKRKSAAQDGGRARPIL
jgi:hypothetical protein